jgi:hypothetical protein
MPLHGASPPGERHASFDRVVVLIEPLRIGSRHNPMFPSPFMRRNARKGVPPYARSDLSLSTPTYATGIEP